jgi:molybdate transport system ATP-binding protein/molybdate/tungstate transport system ATP-binding protein
MIAIKNLKVDLGGFLLQNINLDIGPGEYFIVLGPTGAGKTVLLESIAGLYPVLEGEVWIGDKKITGLSPEKREIGIVYQDQGLFPHLSVEKNIAFGLKMRKCPKNEAKAKIDAIADMVGASHLLKRSPVTLSGGEKQKVALARALVTEPKVLLLDEPLSALDPETRERMQEELREIHRRIALMVIHVTHDFEEAIALGHRVAVLNDGRIAQIGTPEEFLRRPSSEFVARFALTRNILSGRVVGAQKLWRQGRQLVRCAFPSAPKISSFPKSRSSPVPETAFWV